MADKKDIYKIVKNSSFLNLSTIINNIIGLALVVYIGRYLSRDDFGSYIFIFSFVVLFVIFTDLGLPELTTRQLARNKKIASKYLGNVILLKALLAIVTYAFIYLATSLTAFSPSIKIGIYIVSLYFIAEYFGKFIHSVFNAFERMEFSAGLPLLLKLLILISVLAAIKLGYGLKQIFWIYAIAGIIYVFVCMRLVSIKIAQPDYKIDFGFCKNIIKTTFPFGLLLIFEAIYGRIDVIILKFTKGELPVALYGAATWMIMAVMFIPVNLSTAFYPAFSRFYQSAQDSLIKYYQKAFQFLLIVVLPLTAATVILAKRFILLFWGVKYIESTMALQILICRLPTVFFIALLRVLLLSADRQKFLTIVVFWVMLLHIGLNVVLVPPFSYIGACIAGLVTSFISFWIYFFYASEKICRINLAAAFAKPSLAALLMSIFIYYFQGINLFLLVSLGTVLYLSFLLLLRTFNKQDVDLIKQLFKREPLQA